MIILDSRDISTKLAKSLGRSGSSETLLSRTFDIQVKTNMFCYMHHMSKMLSFRDTPSSKPHIVQELSRFANRDFALRARNNEVESILLLFGWNYPYFLFYFRLKCK